MHFVENEMVRHENEYQWTSMATENPWLRQGLKENRRSWWAHWSNKITISRLWKHFCSKRNANNKSVIRGLDPRQSRQFSSGSRQWQETVGQGVVRRGRRSNILRLKDGRWEMFVPNWHGNTLKKILWYAIWIPAVFDTLLSNLFVTTYKHHLEFFPWPCSARCGGQDGHEASSSWNQGMARVCVWPSHKSISVMLSEWLESRSTIHVVLSRIINESYNDWLDLLMRDRFQVPMANRAACVGGKPSQETREWWQRSSTMEEQSRMGGPFALFWKSEILRIFQRHWIWCSGATHEILCQRAYWTSHSGGHLKLCLHNLLSRNYWFLHVPAISITYQSLFIQVSWLLHSTFRNYLR